MGIYNIIEDKELSAKYLTFTRNNDDDILDYMRKRDVEIFKRYCLNRGVFVLVRRTNKHSVPYIGVPGFVPKPLECKPKTAKSNATIVSDGHIISSECQGLVVDPHLLKAHAFENSTYDYVMARRVWDKNWGKGVPVGFAVQTDTNSKYYGCVMRVAEGFSQYYPHSRYDKENDSKVKNDLMDIPAGCSYIHGDYDLYAVIHKDRMKERESRNTDFEGVAHEHSKEWEDFEFFVNQHMKVDMIQHGSQEHFREHSDEDVEIFAPFMERHLQVRKIVGESGIKKIYREFFDRHTTGERLYIAGGMNGIKVVNY